MRTTHSGASVANFTVATSSRWKDKNGEAREQTVWHNVVAWGPLATICEQVVQTGIKIYVDGPLITEHYEAKDGTRKSRTYIKAEQVISLATGKDRREEGGDGIVRAPSPGGREHRPAWQEEEMPF